MREIERLLCEREVYADVAHARSLAAEADATRGAIDELFVAWSEAEEDAAALESRLEELTAES